MDFAEIQKTIPAEVELVAVSKKQPVEAIMELYRAGQRLFGESRVQEMVAKREVLPRDIRWHQIGHLQTNKVRFIAPFVELIHSVDSARLLGEISRQAIANQRVIDVLFEIHIAREESKSGWSWDELLAWLGSGEWRSLSGVRFRGTMGIATNTVDESEIRAEFSALADMHRTLRDKFFGTDAGSGGDNPGDVFNILSMGMSTDYLLAIDCGATMVRLGSALFSND